MNFEGSHVREELISDVNIGIENVTQKIGDQDAILNIDKSWNESTAEKITQKYQSFVVIGPQNCGKSTFIKYLINKFRVKENSQLDPEQDNLPYLLDFDCG